MIKIFLTIGTRPEAIKLAPLIKLIHSQPEKFKAIVCSTGQHREMLNQVFSLFDISPDIDLDVMRDNQTLPSITSTILQKIDQEIAAESPDMVIVQGDTTSAFVGALAAFYNKIPVGHVEAGLRTNNKYSPFPEEMNRCLISKIADLNFAPTHQAQQALLKEGVEENKVFITGNTVIDSLLYIRDEYIDTQPATIKTEWVYQIKNSKVVLVTGHRRESFGDGFNNICQAIRNSADVLTDTVFVYPVHMNPNVMKPVHQTLGGHERILLLEPQPYKEFVWLMNQATIVVTDSGGVQEEAPSLGKPVLVMRENTERPEGVEAGNAKLVGTNRELIESSIIDLIQNEDSRKRMTKTSNPYGDGKSSQLILSIIESELASIHR